MPALKILISGAGITGPVLAYFLARSPRQHDITVVERASAPRLTGQNVDLRGNGLEVVRRMGTGVEDAIRSKTTHEQGLRFVDGNDTVWAEFPVDQGKGFTSEIEIMRGDLASILYDETRDLDRVRYIFGNYVDGLEETSDGVTVTFARDRKPEKYDIVIGADGWASRTRELAFSPSQSPVKSLGQYTAYFKIPYHTNDGSWAQWYNAPGGRLFLLRPDPYNNVTRVWMSSMSQTRHLESILTLDIDAQKSALKAHFADAGWRAPRILEHMAAADDFYFQKIAQIKLSSWSNGRVVLVGDAAYAPSPISGMGTTAAITGAYVLAGEINSIRQGEDYRAALERYERKLREFVDTAQKLMPGTPGLANPQTWWGIKVLNFFLWFVVLTGLNKLGGGTPASAMVLPEYGGTDRGEEIRDAEKTG